MPARPLAATASTAVTTAVASAILLATAVPFTAPPAQAAGAAVQRTWHADQARVPGARSAGRNGAGVTVAVLDSWVDGGHQDFEGRVLQGANCLGGTCRAGQGSDQCDHGTHVAGIVAASSYGVAPKARVLPVRVLSYDDASGDCIGRPTDVAAGIRWAMGQGVRVINLSLGPDVPLGGSTAIPDAVAEAAAAGIVVIFSAGNSGAPVTDSYGGNALVVAATAPSGQLASYTQRGSGVDLAAPGGDPADPDRCTQPECVTSLFPGNRYAVSAGTSQAAPLVAGVAALLLAQQPSRTRTQVMARLTGTARPLAQAGSGLVDATAALGATSAPRPATTSPAPRRTTTASSRPATSRPRATTSRAPSATPSATPTSSPTPLPLPSATLPESPDTSRVEPLPLDPDQGVASLPVARAEEVPAATAGLAAGLALTAGIGVLLTWRTGRRRV